jgi:hypothetical protein
MCLPTPSFDQEPRGRPTLSVAAVAEDTDCMRGVAECDGANHGSHWTKGPRESEVWNSMTGVQRLLGGPVGAVP